MCVDSLRAFREPFSLPQRLQWRTWISAHERKTDKNFFEHLGPLFHFRPDCFCNCKVYYALGHLFDVIYIHTRATTPALQRTDASPEKFEKGGCHLKHHQVLKSCFFLSGKYIWCRLKAPTKVCSGEGFETRCALTKSHFPLADALRLSELRRSQFLPDCVRERKKESSWRAFGDFFDNPRCCDANSRRSQRQSEVQSAVQ